MKRYEIGNFDMRADPEGLWCRYDDAIAFARRVAYAAIRWYIHRDIPATNPKAEDEAIDAIIAEASRDA